MSPAFVFPRKNYKDFILHGAPPSNLGLPHKSGWMTAENFLIVLEYFISILKCSNYNPVILFLDNYESQISLVNLGKENGAYLVTFPPHTSH